MQGKSLFFIGCALWGASGCALLVASGQGSRAPSSLVLNCRLDPDAGLQGNFANVTVEGNAVRIFTSSGDSLGIDGEKCDSGKVAADDADPLKGRVRYKNAQAGLDVAFNGELAMDGKIRGAMISGKFQDARTKKSCQVSGHFFCH